MPRLHFFLEQAGISHDRGQDVVEIVGNAAGKRSDRFHFLGLHADRDRAGLGACRLGLKDGKKKQNDGNRTITAEKGGDSPHPRNKESRSLFNFP